jgi:hypothetical protein
MSEKQRKAVLIKMSRRAHGPWATLFFCFVPFSFAHCSPLRPLERVLLLLLLGYCCFVTVVLVTGWFLLLPLTTDYYCTVTFLPSLLPNVPAADTTDWTGWDGSSKETAALWSRWALTTQRDQVFISLAKPWAISFPLSQGS